jgi:hypothetical protein
MSSIKLESNASGTGIFTIASPNSNTNRTLTLPDATGTVQVSGAAISGTTGSFSGDLSFNSGYGSAAVAYGCRAWANFNGTGTVAIRASGNVTSITDNANGHYTVNLTTAMPDVNGAATMEASFGTPFGDQVDNKECYVASSSTIQIGTYNAGAYSDAAYIYVALFR